MTKKQKTPEMLEEMRARMRKAVEARMAKKKESSLKSEVALAQDGLYFALFKVPKSGGLYTFATIKVENDKVIEFKKTVEDLFDIKEAQLLAAILDNQQ